MSVPSQLSVIIVTRGKPDEADGAIANMLNQDRPPDEIVVLDNDPGGSARRAEHIGDRTVRYLLPGEDLGPVAGRNRAAAEARGDILLFMDDYIRFDKYFVTNTIMDAFRPQEVGCLAFQVRNASTRELMPEEYPGQKLDRWGETRAVCALSTSTFAMRRSLFAELGGLDELLFGGEEGLELAFRVVRAGWHIRYLSEILVNYRTSMRDPDPVPAAYRYLRNRVYLAMKHLPLPLVGTYALAWGIISLYQAVRHGDPAAFGQAVRAFRDEGLWPTARAFRQACPPNWAFVDVLLKHEGRAWY